MFKLEEFRLDTRNVAEAISDFLIKHKQITSPDMISDITYYTSNNESEYGDECSVVVKTVYEKVENT